MLATAGYMVLYWCHYLRAVRLITHGTWGTQLYTDSAMSPMSLQDTRTPSALQSHNTHSSVKTIHPCAIFQLFSCGYVFFIYASIFRVQQCSNIRMLQGVGYRFSWWVTGLLTIVRISVCSVALHFTLHSCFHKNGSERQTFRCNFARGSVRHSSWEWCLIFKIFHIWYIYIYILPRCLV